MSNSPMLNVSKELQFPIDAATETFGILAKKGAGKSNAAVVMAEEMWDAGVPWVAVDPKGDWWGLRSSGDGKGPGLPIVVFGGRHGDVPLEPTAGPLIADLVLDQRLTCVLDVSEFSKADVRRFLLAFAERLYRQADADPLHLFLEEAHEYLPQMVRGPEAELVGAWQRIVKQGRFKGLGCTLVSQRSASLNKDVLTQVDTLIVLRTTSPQDRAAVKAWVDVHADSEAMLDTLPSLADGEAWVWSPEFLRKLERVKFRRRRTFDSGATPKVGQARKAPATLADVDLAAIKEQMAETIERVKADDPKELKRHIRELEKELRDRPAPEPVVERVEVPVLGDSIVERLTRLTVLESALEEIAALRAEVGRVIELWGDRDRKDVPRARPTGDRAAPSRLEGRRAAQRPDLPERREPRRAPVPRPETPESELSGYATHLLTAIAARHPMPLTERQWSVAADRSTTSSGWSPAVRELVRSGYVVRDGGDWKVSDAGLEVAGVDPGTPPPTGAELVEWWCRRITGPGAGAAQTALRILASEPEPISQDELADIAGWSRTSSGPGGAVTVLVKLGLAERLDGLIYLDETLR